MMYKYYKKNKSALKKKAKQDKKLLGGSCLSHLPDIPFIVNKTLILESVPRIIYFWLKLWECII